MKRIILVIIIGIVMVSTLVFGQNLTATTSAIHVNLKEGLRPSKNVPSILWHSPLQEHSATTESFVQISATVVSALPISKVQIDVKDAITKVSYGVKNLNANSKISERIYLPSPSVLLELLVTNAEGLTVSSGRSIVSGVDLLGNSVLVDRKDYALIFATDKYDHWDDLVNPINDAHSIADELKSKYGFETEIVENPTIEDVWEKLRAYNERKFKPQDQLLVFFAGHGQFDESFGEGYVVAKNSLANDKSKTTYISHNRLRGVVNNIPCEHIFMMMDVCFGGTFDPVLARARSAMALEATDEELIVRKLSHKTRKYLTSGGKEYVSDGIPGHHSPFATKLLESFKTEGGADKILTIAEIQTNMEKLKQLPRFGSFGDDQPLSDFIFIRKR
ncbi:MAG: caspase family protein [Cyclobacteriaceae bacterium]|nr:caspase family protein [Cyclobacteriaceae bacterium]